MHDIYDRAKCLMLLNYKRGKWGRQFPDGGGWKCCTWRGMRLADIEAHLAGRCWIACCVPPDEMTDRLVFDVDCKAGPPLDDRDDRYHWLRDFLDIQRTPLVWATPSRWGLRVAYRIPRTRLAELRAGDKKGLIPEVLQAAGFPLGKGSLELFPSNVLDRQLLGRSMPILDPETLEPIIGRHGEPYSAGELREAVDWIEGWHAHEDRTLLDHLRTLPRARRSPASIGRSRTPRSERIPAEKRAIPAVAQSPMILMLDGLQAPSSRFTAEFLVGQSIWRWPDLFDLGDQPSRKAVAEALANWLSLFHNDRSQEWTESVHRLGLLDAWSAWTARYLQRGADGLAPVDRMRRAAACPRQVVWSVAEVSVGERRLIAKAANRARGEFACASDRYKFEVWSAAMICAAKRQIRRGGRSGDASISAAHLAVEWMREWPYGANYRRYREILIRHGVVSVVKRHRWPPVDDRPPMASVYQIQDLEWVARSDLAISTQRVDARIQGLKAGGRPLSRVEAYHALHADAHGVDLAHRYGRRVAARMRDLLGRLRRRSVLA